MGSNQPVEVEESTNGPSAGLKWLGLAVGLLAAVYALFGGDDSGGRIFGVIIAGLTILRELSERDQDRVANACERFRAWCQAGDAVARFLLMMIATGGTLLAVDHYRNIDFLLPHLDTVVKRASPALVLTTVAIYVASAVGKLVYRASVAPREKRTRSYEFLFYVSVLLFCSSTTLFFLGFPMEEFIPSSSAAGATRDGPVWSDDLAALIMMLIEVSVVWGIGFLGCLLSRQFEWRAGQK